MNTVADYEQEKQSEVDEARALFESIICLCAEGREVVARRHLLDAIQREAERGYLVMEGDDETYTVEEIKSAIAKCCLETGGVEIYERDVDDWYLDDWKILIKHLRKEA